jgi:hypothetical protein
LFVRGDDRDNTISLASERDTIQVTCDGHAEEFSGVRNFDVEAGGGDDFIIVIIHQEQPATCDIDAGAGSDRVVSEWSWGETPDLRYRATLGDGDDSWMATFIPVEQIQPEAPMGLVQVEGIGGGGTERFDVYVGDPSNGVSALNADVTIDLDGGRGPSIQNVTFHRTEITGSLALRMAGGNDDDALNVLFEDNEESPAPLHGSVEVQATTYGGLDAVGFVLCKSKSFGPMNMGINTGQDADKVDILIEDSEFFGSLAMASDTENGADEVGFVICRSTVLGPLDAAMNTGVDDDIASVFCMNNLITGGLAATMNTGDGDDAGSVSIDGGEFVGPVSLAMDTGDGDDSGGVLVANLEQFGGELRARILTGRGHDDASMTLRDSHDFSATLDVLVDTADGDDRASLLIERFFRFGRLLNFTLDTGAGNDSGNVMISDSDGPSEGVLNVNVATGSGIDHVATSIAFTPHPEAPSQSLEIGLMIDAGSEADIVRAALDLAGNRYRALRVGIVGGHGGDDIGLELGGIGNVDVVDVRMDSGGGDDRVRASVAGAGGLGDSLGVEILTGNGVDDVFAAVAFNPQPDPPGEPFSVLVRIDAGADDDMVRAAFDLAGRRCVTLRAELLGGKGHDDLGLLLAGIGNPNEFTALIDGGAGHDRAVLTRNILARALIRNVEELLLTE